MIDTMESMVYGISKWLGFNQLFTTASIHMIPTLSIKQIKRNQMRIKIRKNNVLVGSADWINVSTFLDTWILEWVFSDYMMFEGLPIEKYISPIFSFTFYSPPIEKIYAIDTLKESITNYFNFFTIEERRTWFRSKFGIPKKYLEKKYEHLHIAVQLIRSIDKNKIKQSNIFTIKNNKCYKMRNKLIEALHLLKEIGYVDFRWQNKEMEWRVTVKRDISQIQGNNIWKFFHELIKFSNPKISKKGDYRSYKPELYLKQLGRCAIYNKNPQCVLEQKDKFIVYTDEFMGYQKHELGAILGDSKGIESQWDIDHIIPKSKGGSDEIENLQLLCFKCHRAKTKDENKV